MTAEKETVKQYYDDHIASKLRNYVYGNPRVQKAFDTLYGLTAHRPLQNILEVGCGVGYISSALRQAFPKSNVWGFEISEKSIACAEALFSAPGIQFVRADTLPAWPCPAGLRFDLVVLMDVYEHIPVAERDVVHQWIKDHLAPGGSIFLSCPTPAFLAWLKIHEPHTIQPVDEDIDGQSLLCLAQATGTSQVFYAEQNVWHVGDYFHTLLTANPYVFGKSPKPAAGNRPSLTGKILRRASTQLKKLASGKRAKEIESRRTEVARVTGLHV